MGSRVRATVPAHHRRLLATFAAIAVLTLGFALSPERSGAQAPSRATVFVVDTSTSMKGVRLAEAQSALVGAASAIPAGARVGLRSFGGPCEDGGTVRLPLGPFAESSFAAAVQSLSTGLPGTPTPAALRAAAAGLPATGDRTLILISDGNSGCGDPCVVARELAGRLGPDFRIDTVGFNAPNSAEAELDCIARATGGSYVSVADAAGLAATLAQSTAPRVTALRVVPSRFRAAAEGASISRLPRARFGARVTYTISERVRVRFTVERVSPGRRVGGRCRLPGAATRRAPRCARFVKLPGSFVHDGRQGNNSLTFTGRVGGRRLGTGLYHLVATAIDGTGRASKQKRVAFRIVSRLPARRASR